QRRRSDNSESNYSTPSDCCLANNSSGSLAIFAAIRRASSRLIVRCWSPSATPVQNSGRNNVPNNLFLDHGAGRQCVGEPSRNLTHHSFNGGADEYVTSVL